MGLPARAQARTTSDRGYAVPTYRGPYLDPPARRESPDPDDLASVKSWVRGQTSPTAIDLFCGAGGLSLGLQAAGFTILVGADADPASVKTHTANIGGLGYVGDLSDPSSFLSRLNGWGIRSVDLVAGGPPCQPFSRAGRSKIRSLVESGHRPAADARAEMWRNFVTVVASLRPKAVLLENVPDLAVWNEGALLTSLSEALRELGFHTDARIVNAFEHGVPQHRSRLFLVGFRSRRVMTWPRSSRAKPTVRSAISDLPSVPPAQREERLPYTGSKTALQRKLRRGVSHREARSVFDHITRDLREDDAQAFALLPPGGIYKSLPKHLQRYRADIFDDKYKRLEWDALSRSITAHLAKDGYWYIHPDQDRTISVREAARIQTFPDWFRFAGQPSLRFRQIGNAVPPLLAESVGRALWRCLTSPAVRGRPPSTRTSFRSQLLEWHESHTRRFPWRETTNPWHVLMAEMCLRRTRADQVVAVYKSLLEVAPTPQAMVFRADDVLATMHSLGLRWRAENLIRVAQLLVQRHDGRVPSTEIELRLLPGVGDYVSAAVLGFGFSRKAVLLDTNTERIVARLNGNPTRRWQLRLDLHRLAGQEGPDGRFNYAMLDLGALVCTARAPTCPICPVQRHCETHRQLKRETP